jgi:hypothetical protein
VASRGVHSDELEAFVFEEPNGWVYVLLTTGT